MCYVEIDPPAEEEKQNLFIFAWSCIGEKGIKRDGHILFYVFSFFLYLFQISPHSLLIVASGKHGSTVRKSNLMVHSLPGSRSLTFDTTSVVIGPSF